MKRAFLLLFLAGCVPPPPAPEPEPPITVQAAHPDWKPKECEAVREGAFWEGMDIEQFKCASRYGRVNNMDMYPGGPHVHMPFDSVSQTKGGLVVRYRKAYLLLTGYFDNDMKLTEYVRTVR